MTSHHSFHHKFTTWLTLTTFFISCLSPLQVLAMQHDGEKNHHNSNSGQQRISHAAPLSTIDKLLAADEEDLKQKIETICNQGQQGITAPKATLTGPGLGQYKLSQETALDLLSLNADGEEVKENKEGMHPVKGRGGVHFKSNHHGDPLTPAMEKAIYLLQMLLVGEGITPSTLLVLKDVMLPKQGSTSHIIQASRTAKGISLQKFFEDVEQGQRSWDDLDLQNFSAQILSSLLIYPFDARPDNFMVVFDKDGKGHIVGIDNDKALSEPILREMKLKGQHPRVAHYVGNKNILYCLQELMEKKVNNVIAERILSHNPYALTLKWLQNLDHTNNQYQYLQKLNLLSGDEAQKLELPFCLAPGKVLQLVDQLEHMQAYLRSASQGVSHNQLFEFLYPLVYEHYQALIRDASNPKNRKGPPYPLNVISRIFPGQREEKSLQQILPLRARLKNDTPIYKALREETGHRLAHKECTQSIAQAAEELIKHCDLSLYYDKPNSTDQAELLLAGQAFPQSLAQAHLSWRDPRLVQKVFRGELPAEVLEIFPHLGIDLSGESLLHQALDNSPEIAYKLIDQLVDQGISLEERDDQYRTILEVAMEKRLYPVVNHLIHKGAKEVWLKVAFDYYKSLDPADQKSRLSFKYLEAVNPELLWHRSLDTLLPKEGEGRTLQGAKSGHRVLPKILEGQLFKTKQEVIKVNDYGRRKVGRIEKDGYSLYFKQYPEFPGTEQGVSSLLHSLIGQGAPYGELFCIEGCPYYVSQGVQGLSLQDVLYDKERELPHSQKHVESYLKKLSPKAISEMIVMAMLLNPEDGKPDNYIIEPLRDGSYRLVGIDNDHAFGPVVAREEQGVIPQVKCVLYCLDQMQHSLDHEVWEKFRTIDSPQALKKWLIGLSAVNKGYEALFKDSNHVKRLLTQKDKESFIGVAFTPLMLRRLYEKFVRFQHVLSKEDNDKRLSHLELLKQMEPVLYERYHGGFERDWPHQKGNSIWQQKGNSIWQRFMTIDGPYFKKGKDGVPLSSHTLASFLTSLKIPLKEELIEEIRKGHHIGPDLAMLELEAIIKEINKRITGMSLEDFKDLKTDKQRTKLLRRLKFNTMSFPEQRAWIEALAHLEGPRILMLKGCEALVDENFTGEPVAVPPSAPPPQPSFLERLIGTPKPVAPIYVSLPLIEVKNLRKLDISGCRALTQKAIDYILKSAPALETLNLSGLVSLSSLSLVSQSLKWLSVEGCSNLRDIKLQAPNLGTLVTKGCSQLSSLKLDTSALRILDLRELPLLTNEMLDSQIQNYFQLKELKLEGCNQISFREIREKRPLYPVGLFEEISPETQKKIIKMMDTNNETSLNLGMQKVSYRRFIILDALRGGKRSLGAHQIGAKGAKALAPILRDNTTLTKLILGLNEIGAEGANALASVLKDNKTLTSLNLTGNNIAAEGANALASVLKDNKTLTSLNLWYNQIGAEGARVLATALQGNTTLKKLDLEFNNIGDEGAKALAPVLQHNTTLTELNLESNEIGAEGAKALAPALQGNTNLTKLYLKFNNIGDEGAKALAPVLQHNTTLTELDLESNEIGAEGAKALAPALQGNTNLTKLYLGSNNIGDEGAKALAPALQGNTNLTKLYLGSNNIGAKGAKALASGLQHNTTLTLLDLGNNPDFCDNVISDEGMKALAPALRDNKTLTFLSLGANKIGDEGVKALVPVLRHNTTLTELHLWDNKIGDEGAEALATALQYNKTLTKLDLGSNKIGAYQSAVIKELLERNKAQRSSALSQVDNKIKPKFFKASFKDSSLTLTQSDNLEADDTSLHLLTGVDKATVLHHLKHAREDIMPLLMPLVVQAFKTGQLSGSLPQDGRELLQQWQQSQTSVQTWLAVLKEYLPSCPEQFETVESFLKNHPEHIEALSPEGQGACKEFAKTYLASQQFDEQVHRYCADESIFAAFIEGYFSQSQYLYQEQGLKALAQVFGIQFHLWQQEGQSLIHQVSFGEDIYEKNVHLLKQDSSLTLLENSEQTHEEQQKSSGKGKERVKDDEQDEEVEEECSQSETEEESSSGSTSIESSTSQTSSSQEEIFLDTQRSDRDADTLYVGLSLDGGGICTYMTAYNLQKLEDYAGKPLYELIDYIGGTSMGGILALGAMASEDSYTPLWKPNQMMDLFTKHGSNIFSKSRGKQRLWDEDLTPKLESICYPSDYFEKHMRSYFGSLRLSDVLKPTLVTALKVNQKASKGRWERHHFKSTLAQSNEYYDYFIRDIARAVSAAPGTFPRVPLRNVFDEGNEQIFLDAGTKHNNPARSVYDNIINLYSEGPYRATKENTFIISIGIGQCSTSNPEIADLMASTSHEVHLDLEEFLGKSRIEGRIYYRLQPTLEQDINITDARPETFEVLEEAVGALKGYVQALARILAENKDRKHPASL